MRVLGLGCWAWGFGFSTISPAVACAVGNASSRTIPFQDSQYFNLQTVLSILILRILMPLPANNSQNLGSGIDKAREISDTVCQGP